MESQSQSQETEGKYLYHDPKASLVLPFLTTNGFPQAVRLMQGDDFVVYRSLTEPKETNIRFVQDKIDTLEKVFRLAISQHAHKPALGTRKILSEEEELQPNGQILKKVRPLPRKSVFVVVASF